MRKLAGKRGKEKTPSDSLSMQYTGWERTPPFGGVLLQSKSPDLGDSGVGEKRNMARRNPSSLGRNAARGRSRPISRISRRLDPPSSSASASVSTSGANPAPVPSDDDVPEIYMEMLSESRSQHQSTVNRPLKRRRIGERTEMTARSADDGLDTQIQDGGDASIKMHHPETENLGKSVVQTIYDLDISDDDESEPDWEDIDIQGQAPASSLLSQNNQEESLQITLHREDSKGKEKTVARRRKPVTGQEKKRRLDIHKLHLLCLLSHVERRNSWCNNEQTQKFLRRMLPKSVVLCLNPKPELPQFTRSTTFADGLKRASEIFHRRFRVTEAGMRSPRWLEDLNAAQNAIALQSNTELVVSKSDFQKQSESLQGSRDFGAQLFCALLRGAGVDTRLVCSLQPLPFTGAAKGDYPQKPGKEYITISDDDVGSSNETTGTNTPATEANPPRTTRRIGQPRFSSSSAASPARPATPTTQPLNIQNSPYPVYWVECFNDAMQKWVSVDPIATNTVGKPSQFEPPASDRYNNMSYVIAFDEDGFAKDVTRRYTKAFSSKTRRFRVEYTQGGERWWNRTMRAFEQPFPQDRDQLELGELTSKSAAEGMPRNVQDFKNHPIYALERHLRSNEVIYPKREIGRVGVTKLSINKKIQPLEPVYRRADVCTVKSADGWYRQGRSVKPGEQPLKRRQPLRKATTPFAQADPTQSDEEAAETPMYAAFQTELYKPLPVVNKCVQKNAYGNIDVYTPTMVPEGGVHIKHPDAIQAARLLGIDFAVAVTGFKFKGRHGTAVTEGIVAAVEYQEALDAVIDGLQDERAQQEDARKTMAALLMWKKLLIKLRVAERINSYRIEGEDDSEEKERSMSPIDDFSGAGGFIPEEGDFGSADRPGDDDISAAGGFLVEENDYLAQDTTVGMEEASVSQGPSTQMRGLDISATQQSNLNQRPEAPSQYTLIVVPNNRNEDIPAPSQEPIPPGPVAQRPEGADNLLPDTTNANRIDPLSGLPGNAPLQTESSYIYNPELDPDSEAISPIADMDAPDERSVPDLIHVDSDSDIDCSSMLSHDPDDDDAEPDWLLSD
ncbi:hypothetical protein FQN57_000592 [Myotisia sp. PD_48]|nr:hypothetical protein FQN57_000592 [Myotisia sp. PD_48]